MVAVAGASCEVAAGVEQDINRDSEKNVTTFSIIACISISLTALAGICSE
jgi:hydroxymethylpyrimidine/phosphomethylpyrimidine kinase